MRSTGPAATPLAGTALLLCGVTPPAASHPSSPDEARVPELPVKGS